jgi:hypothetical protein
LFVPGSDEASREGFGGIGEAVVHVGEKGEYLEQKRIDRQQDRVLHTGRCRREEGIYGYDTERTDDDVAVDEEKFPHRFPVHHFTPRKPCENFAVSQDKQQDSQQNSRILGHDRAVGDARDAHAVSEYEPQARGNVYDIHRDGDTHRDHGILHACVPAVESEKHDTGGYRPDAGVEIVVYDFVAVHGPQCQSAQRVLEANNQQAENRCDQNAPDKHVGAFVEVSCTESLRRESAGTHAYEAAVPVDEVEDGYADGECPDRRCGVIQVSRDGGTHDAHKGDRDVGDDVRNG